MNKKHSKRAIKALVILMAFGIIAASTTTAAMSEPNFTPVPGYQTWSSKLLHQAQMTGCETCQYEFQRCLARCDAGNYGGYMTYGQCQGVCGTAAQACMQAFC